MKALVIYDTTGKIWSVTYGITETPQGLLCMFVDMPDGAMLEYIDVTDSKNPKPVFSYLPESDIGRIQKDMRKLIERVDAVAPEEKKPETLKEFKTAKKQEISQACEQIIYAGISVTLADGTVEHFALTEHDQLNLFGKQAQLATGAEQLEYHSDGKPCRYYSATDMQTIIAAAMQHVSYHTTYCNALNMWVAGCETADELQQIYYGVDVPEQYQSEVLKAYLLEIASLAGDDADA
jgi:hypothetical protein